MHLQRSVPALNVRRAIDSAARNVSEDLHDQFCKQQPKWISSNMQSTERSEAIDQYSQSHAPKLSPHSFLKYATKAVSRAHRWQNASNCSFAMRRASSLLTLGIVKRMICSRSAKMGSTLALSCTCSHSETCLQRIIACCNKCIPLLLSALRSKLWPRGFLRHGLR